MTNSWLKWLIGIGAGGAAFLILRPKAYASEDESGAIVPPSDLKSILPPAPPSLPPAQQEAKAKDAARGVPPAPAPASTGGLGAKAVEVLARDVNAHEEPWPHFPKKPYPNTNRGVVVDRIVRGVYNDGESLLGKPWCARAVRYAYEQAAKELGLPPPFAALKSKLAAVTDWYDLFKDYRSDTPRPGMAALILDGDHRHATLVAAVQGNNIVTVEGNHADQVASVTRPKSKFKTFIDVEAYVNRAPQTRVSGLDVLGCV